MCTSYIHKCPNDQKLRASNDESYTHCICSQLCSVLEYKQNSVNWTLLNNCTELEHINGIFDIVVTGYELSQLGCQALCGSALHSLHINQQWNAAFLKRLRTSVHERIENQSLNCFQALHAGHNWLQSRPRIFPFGLTWISLWAVADAAIFSKWELD